jgi:hypothetical protein
MIVSMCIFRCGSPNPPSRGSGSALPRSALASGYTPVRSYYLDVCCAAVRVQAKAWMDRATAHEWAQRTLKKHLQDVGGLRVERLLLMDNLDAQVGPLRLCTACAAACAAARAASACAAAATEVLTRHRLSRFCPRHCVGEHALLRYKWTSAKRCGN